ncbi:hypothetical protein BIW11_14294 [Tropilaelaps mercedesae]|uniref:Cysteine/serine-rich nuclear protein N-terminal domain-containing protein n=1 Tax=Tropilaelaps mercedesae TaxID=418985 RepID=A0A1V9WY94_9ACAR|nr:hypothetical protein BIW11_14294 [Tropilaelaps mercedesae]
MANFVQALCARDSDLTGRAVNGASSLDGTRPFSDEIAVLCPRQSYTAVTPWQLDTPKAFAQESSLSYDSRPVSLTTEKRKRANNWDDCALRTGELMRDTTVSAKERKLREQPEVSNAASRPSTMPSRAVGKSARRPPLRNPLFEFPKRPSYTTHAKMAPPPPPAHVPCSKSKGRWQAEGFRESSYRSPRASGLDTVLPKALVSCLKSTRTKKNRARRKKVGFDKATVYQFERAQGVDCVPSQGGSTLGMTWTHCDVQEHRLAEQPKQTNSRRRSRRPIHRPALEPISVEDRSELLRHAGVTYIDPMEIVECEQIRTSRERIGCDCKVLCDPSLCFCTKESIACQADGSGSRCWCTRNGCRNPNGRNEFDALAVKAHVLRTCARANRELGLYKERSSISVRRRKPIRSTSKRQSLPEKNDCRPQSEVPADSTVCPIASENFRNRRTVTMDHLPSERSDFDFDGLPSEGSQSQ